MIREETEELIADHHRHCGVESAHTRTRGHHHVHHHDAGHHRHEAHLEGGEGVPATARTAAIAEAELDRGAARQVALATVAEDEQERL